LPEDRGKGSPRERFRNILSAEDADQPDREPRKPTVVNLPKVGDRGTPLSLGPRDRREPAASSSDRGHRLRLLPTFWTVGGILSVIANLVLLSMLLGGRSTWSSGGAAGGLPGVYASLVQLDSAHIRTTIPFETTMAMDTTVPVKTSTRITLANELLVRGAHITVNSSGLSIDSPADITLPAGTAMDVKLDLALPIQTALPVNAEVPVDIAISDTELHAAIQSLQAALRPLVCANAPRAALPDGTPICN